MSQNRFKRSCHLTKTTTKSKFDANPVIILNVRPACLGGSFFTQFLTMESEEQPDDESAFLMFGFYMAYFCLKHTK